MKFLFYFLSIFLALVICSDGRIYQVITKDDTTELKSKISRQKRDLRPQNDFLEILEEDFTYFDESDEGSGNVVTLPPYYSPQTLTYYLQNDDLVNRGRVALQDVVPSGNKIIDLILHNETPTERKNKLRQNNVKVYSNEKEAKAEFNKKIEKGYTAALLDVTNSKYSEGELKNRKDNNGNQGANAVIDLAPGDTVSVTITFEAEFNMGSLMTDGETYHAETTIQIDPVNSKVQGLILSPNYEEGDYPNNADISWLVTYLYDKTPYSVNLTVLELNTQACCDHLYLYDGSSTSSNVLAILSGTDLNTGTTFTSNTGSLLAKFDSDCRVHNGGFALSFKSTDPPQSNNCNSYEIPPKYPEVMDFNLEENQGTVNNPGYPVGYSPDSQYSWSISVTNSFPDLYSYSIKITITDVDINSADTLQIWDTSNNNELIAAYNGANETSRITYITGMFAKIVFLSGSSNLDFKRGFSISYIQVINDLNGSVRELTSTDEWQNIESPNFPMSYENNEYIQWIITSSADLKIVVQVENISLEPTYDTIKLYSNRETTKKYLIASLFGENDEPNIAYVSPDNIMVVVFESDASVVLNGFKLNYKNLPHSEETCQTSVDLESELVENSVMSPYYPSSYINTKSCSWQFTASEGSCIQFNVHGFSSYSYKETIDFYDGPTSNDNIIFEYNFVSPYDPIKVFKSSKNNVLVQILGGSNYYFFTYQTATCDGQFNDNMLTLPQGYVSTPFYPYSYSSNTYSTWQISVATGYGLYLDVIYFSTYSTDELSIYQGTSINDTLLQTCSYYYCYDQSVNSTKAFLTFITENFYGSSYDGFNIQYYALQSDCTELYEPITSNEGYVVSQNYPDAYTNSLDCAVTVTVNAENVVAFRFLYLNTEASSDVITVYDGPSTSDNILRTFSGYYSSSQYDIVYYSSSNQITVRFQTDSDGVYGGFDMYYIGKVAEFTEDSAVCKSYSVIEVDYFTTRRHLSSPGYPEQYSPNSDYCWILKADERVIDHIHIDFKFIDTEKSFDFIRFYTGLELNENNLMREVSGYLDSYYTTLYGSNGIVYFHSDSKIAGDGFYMDIYGD